LGRFAAAWRFVQGRGPVPRLHAQIPETTFANVEEASVPRLPSADAVLERYYSLKVGSLQFCGSACFGFAFWQGFEALALTLPVIGWLARAMPQRTREEAVTRAVGIVDYGFNRVQGMRRQRLALAILSRRGELERLIARYGS
jgi:hypothetical protein